MSSEKKLPLERLQAIVEKANQLKTNIPEFPVEAFPGVYQKYIQDIVRTTDATPDHLGTFLLTVAGGALGNAYQLEIKKGWKCKPILFSACIAPSGMSKTVGAKKAMSPIKVREMEYKREYEREKKTWEEEKEAAEKEKRSAPPEPKSKRIFLSNITPEKIHVIHEYNPKGLLVFRDELSGFLKSLNKYRKGDDEEFFMELYNGDSAPIDRIGRETVYVENHCVSIMGGMTPGNIEEIAGGGKEENGFMQRFIYAYPETKSLGDMPEEEQNMEIYGTYSAAINNLLDLEMKHTEEGYKPNIISFSEEAKTVWRDWNNGNRRKINEVDSQITFLRGAYAKFAETCCRIALIIEVMKHSCNQSGLQYVGKDSVISAIALIEYYRACSIKIYNEIQEERMVLAEEEGDNKYYTVDWQHLFAGEETLPTSEIIKRLQDIYPKISLRTCKNYIKTYLEPVSWGIHKVKENKSETITKK